MSEILAELDPGYEVVHRAQELGFYVVHHSVSRKASQGQMPPTDLIRSDVVCAPAIGEIFEPAELNEMLSEIVPSQLDAYFVENKQGARFETPSWLRLPVAEIARRVGTSSVKAEIDITGEETYVVRDVKELYAQSRVMMAPTRQFAESVGGLRIDFVVPSMLDKNTGERKAFKSAVRNNFSWWERFSSH